ncbi:MAG: translocation/assembly module TamB domain-containing protein [Deltaproteobacteria bacterium]|nr:translocation/assembly module TamB domain-containing protein [Deltaproteobacteria bacterium]
MKIWLTSISLAVLLLLGLFGSGSWLLYSPSGTNWLLTRLITAQGGSIGKINGTLIGQLQLTDVEFATAGQKLRCADLELHSRLQQLFPLQLKIERLQLENLLVDRQTTENEQQAFRLNWPELPSWLALVEIDLQQLKLVDFRLRQAERVLFNLEHFKSQVRWRNQSLQFSKLQLQLPEMTIEGELKTTFSAPSLISDLQVRQRQPGHTWQQLTLKMDLQAAENLLFAGPVSLALYDSQNALFSAAGELGLGAEELQFRRLRLQRPKGSGTLTASGSLLFGTLSELNAHLQLSEFDLQPETGQAIKLSGELDITGSLHSYRGNFKLTNRAEKPLDVRISGTFAGDQSRLQLNNLQGEWLSGALGGQAQFSWSNGWQAAAQLSGRALDPHLLNAQLIGELNLDVQAEFASGEQSPDGRLTLLLNNSTLHNQPLSGTAELSISNRQLEINQLELLGEGIQLQGAGRLEDKIKLSWQIERLEQLFAGFQGQATGNGWLSLQPEGISAEFSTKGARLGYKGWQLEQGQLLGKTLADQQHWQLQFEGQQLSGTQPQLELENIQLKLEGALEKHNILLRLGQADAHLQAELIGGWSESAWQGSLTALAGEDQRLGDWQARHAVPLSLSAARIQLDPLELTSDGHGELRFQGYLLPPSQTAEAQLQWQQLDLGLLRPWLDAWEVTGNSSGAILLQMTEERKLRGNLSLQGQLKNDKLSLNLQHGQWQADWSPQGLQSDLSLELADGSQLQAKLSSPNGVAIGWPRQGDLKLSGKNFPLTRLQPWLPLELNLTGSLDWQTLGQWQPEQPWSITGKAKVTDGRFFRQEEDDIISAQLNVAELNWDWQEQLSGRLELELQEHGNIDAQFKLPISATWPIQWDSSQLVSGDLSARLQELGLLSVIFPGRVQESRGQLKLDLQLTGSWEQPILRGDARLFDAGAFLPTLGIQLKDIDLASTFDMDRIRIETFRLTSADGPLSGQGQVTLSNWRPQNYQLQLKGERFQLVHLPDLQIRVTPDLSINGDMTSYRLRGTISVPELLVSSRKRTSLAENSPDLLVVDAAAPAEKSFKLTHDIDLQLLLGEQVLVNSAGIDAKLDGHLQLQSTARQELAAFGQIHVVKGKYASYGVSLDITRGNLFFNGGALDQPALDILALRKAGEVQAGVKVTGTPKQPVVQLYSEPTMAETDILSYIVLGRPVGGSSSQSSLLMTAAGALLSQGESVILQEKLKNRLGLDVLDISAGEGDVSSSIITTGKYLSPDLYVSLGYSLFSNSNEMKVRYNLTPSWELESNIGTESGVDLFYKIDIK